MAPHPEGLAAIRLDFQTHYGKKATVFAILARAVLSPAFRAIVLYRLQHSAYRERRTALLNLLGFVRLLTVGIELSYSAIIGCCLRLPHAQGIVIGSGAVVGNYAEIYQGVTIGTTWDLRTWDEASKLFGPKVKDGRKYPIIGDNVRIGVGATIVGPITVGNDVVVGAHAVVLEDVPNRCVVAGIPAKVLRYL
jgi:serine O-acetyltransferase